MSQDLPRSSRAGAALRWPLGIGLTAWRYMWRTTPMRRHEAAVEAADRPAVPQHLRDGVQLDEDGVGPLYHRRYRVTISGSRLTAADVMERVQSNPNVAAPTEFARFHKLNEETSGMREGDEYLVHMPGPWNGPVRVVEVKPSSFRFATLETHLEAGQIEFRAQDEDGLLVFEIESWARSGDRLAAVLYDTFPMAKEVQLHMWTSFLEKVIAFSGGTRRGLLSIETRRLQRDG